MFREPTKKSAKGRNSAISHLWRFGAPCPPHRITERVSATGDNQPESGAVLEAKGEQFDGSDPKDQDCECHRIVFEPNAHHIPPFRYLAIPRGPVRVLGLGRNAVSIAMSGNRTRFQTL